MLVDDGETTTRRRRRFIGVVVDGVGWWAVDVPVGLARPVVRCGGGTCGNCWDGTTAAGMVEAGRAVQTAEWVRTQRTVDARDADRAVAGRAWPEVPVVWAPGLSPRRAGNDHVGGGGGRSDQEALLARGTKLPNTDETCLAGFVEPGEDLEGFGGRGRMKEEVGVDVDSVRCIGGQSRGDFRTVSSSRHRRTTPAVEMMRRKRCSNVNWYRKDDLPLVPPEISIAGTIINAWIAE